MLIDPRPICALTYEGSSSTVQSLLTRNNVHYVRPNNMLKHIEKLRYVNSNELSARILFTVFIRTYVMHIAVIETVDDSFFGSRTS